MTDEPVPAGTEPTAARPAPERPAPDPGAADPGAASRENKGSPEPWQPDEQRYADRPEQGGATPGPAIPEPPD
ncbi:hypothetical protein [Actinoplanes sp. N902-109]|uniref:hypothetical protein n=1 Tax=Actinoplanes sp. (strain N902-109) TaxID=649831 RepID=UPI000329597E|nr:hypothetical protein [Actinoplanes sp. N902-109]AGL21153.1 hypothetical protein L083_7643 [Actinoplanes sp. N902-109]